MRIGPVAFLFVVAAGWATLRALMLWPESGVPAAPRRIAWQPPLRSPMAEARPTMAEARVAALPAPAASAPQAAIAASEVSPDPVQPPLLVLVSATAEAADGSTPIFPPQPEPGPPPERPRLSLSAWAIVRGEGGPGLASAGQLGGSQAGVRARFDLGSGLAAALRVSGPLRSRSGKEAAAALDWRPVRRLPVTVSIERRAGLDRGGRDAFAAGIFGGGEQALPLGMRADGYGQAGIVGLKRRDAYIDGALRIERPLVESGRFRLAAGGGAWGGAQPGASRLDIGPQLVAHVPVAKGGLRIGAEWRARVAGQARPGSGPVLSIGADF